MSKTEVIKQYNDDYQNFLSATSMIPENKKGDKILDNWTITEIICHIAAWGPETVKAIQTVTEGKIPWFFDQEREIDKFNDEQIKSRKNSTFPEVLGEIETNHGILIDFLQNFPVEYFHRGFGVTWHRQIVTPALICSYRHYATHAKDIKIYLETNLLDGV